MRRTSGARRGPLTLLATTLLAAVALTPLSAPSAAAEPRATGEAACAPRVAADTERGADQLLSLVGGLRAKGHDDAEIDERLAAFACLSRVDQPGPATEIPPADQVQVTAPAVYSIGQVNGKERWVAFAEWDWSSVPGHPMTGNQAVATWFDTEVSPVLQVVHYAGDTPAFPNVSREDAADVNGWGVGFLMWPEKAGGDMNVATGSLALVFEGQGACTDLTARSAFAHTWNNTGINGLTVGASGVSYDWTDQVDRALTVSQPTTVPGICP
ncbi:hypothetical protein [Streptomyces profundus]|uniref:hypothetical protein n=1 Tax=Streptomyces profundus TaxID=2867410 RepID=UPI001D162771|nr:hypothetical protein [Streptomyces sp. MA3_2.13]UED85892.1 hypothetical protein K4G22_18300 [Streptomyces sp. MA3_2.13]